MRQPCGCERRRCDVLTTNLLLPEVRCDCRPGYIGDGFSCSGNLLQVLQETPTFSNFLTVSYLLSSGASHLLFGPLPTSC